VRRGFWFVAGAGVGVYAVVRARRAAEAFTPEGLRDRAAGLAVGAHLFAEEVRTGMVERETELRERLGLSVDGPLQLEAVDPGPRDLPPPPAPQPRANPSHALEGTH
jgi:hypothetical protein